MSTPEQPGSAPIDPSPWDAPAPGTAVPPPPPPPSGYAPPPYGAAPQVWGGNGGYGVAPPAAGPIGQVRGTGFGIVLTIVTLGIYQYVWWYKTHEEMKRHTGDGFGGVLAVVILLVFGIVMPFVTADEVGKMYARSGRAKPVSATTGLWYFPGILILVGPIVWYVKTNGAINDYWRSLGASG